MLRIPFITKVLTGTIFIISAVLKLLSLDTFELYVYSFGILSLDATMILARLLVAAELLLGLLLTTGIFSKFAIKVSILMLVIFTAFIGFLMISNNNEHCHCFGDAVEISHPLSIIKNIILIIFLIIAAKSADMIKRYRPAIFSLLLLLSIALVFIVSPPDSLRRNNYKNKTSFNKEKLEAFISKHQLQNKKKVAFFFGASCRFCKMAAQKLSVIQDKTDHKQAFLIVFMGDNKKANETFITEYGLEEIENISIDPMEFLKITDGSLPVIFILDKGKILESYSYRSFEEQRILEFTRK